jgi:hypothetical protein
MAQKAPFSHLHPHPPAENRNEVVLFVRAFPMHACPEPVSANIRVFSSTEWRQTVVVLLFRTAAAPDKSKLAQSSVGTTGVAA